MNKVKTLKNILKNKENEFKKIQDKRASNPKYSRIHKINKEISIQQGIISLFRNNYYNENNDMNSQMVSMFLQNKNHINSNLKEDSETYSFNEKLRLEILKLIKNNKR